MSRHWTSSVRNLHYATEAPRCRHLPTLDSRLRSRPGREDRLYRQPPERRHQLPIYPASHTRMPEILLAQAT